MEVVCTMQETRTHQAFAAFAAFASATVAAVALQLLCCQWEDRIQQTNRITFGSKRLWEGEKSFC